jgi:hypothetical protein
MSGSTPSVMTQAPITAGTSRQAGPGHVATTRRGGSLTAGADIDTQRRFLASVKMSFRETAKKAASTATRTAKNAVRAAAPRDAICDVFGRYCQQALSVAHCESRFDTEAQNGQYLGLFQMGHWERRTYGHGLTPFDQARAAHRYFVASGRDWSPWSCKPW